LTAVAAMAAAAMARAAAGATAARRCSSYYAFLCVHQDPLKGILISL